MIGSLDPDKLKAWPLAEKFWEHAATLLGSGYLSKIWNFCREELAATLTEKGAIMNPIDKDMKTTWVGLKAGIFESRRKLASPGFAERGEVLRNTQDPLTMAEMSSGNECPTDRTAQGKKRDNYFVDMHANYVLRTRLSWTGLYGKAPWPRVQKQWEKI